MLMTIPRPNIRLGELSAAFWRRWHRWIGFPAALFLLFVAVTGILVAGTEFFGEEEALREATRDLASPVSLRSSPAVWTQPIARALTTASQRLGNARVDRITLEFKGDHPRVTIFTGKPTGGEDRKVVVDARSGNLVAVEEYADKPFIHRLHSGEAFGDGGLVVAMLWGLTLIVLTVSGLVIYFQMRRRNQTGIRRFFW
jgi:uncharacterized iron-regulated membrane protein